MQHLDAHYNGNEIYTTLDYYGILQLALTVYMYYVGDLESTLLANGLSR